MALRDPDSIVARAAAGPPEPGGYVELTEGILWVRLPIPGALRHINVWLVPTRRGWFLVDTGMRTDDVQQSWESLERRLPLSSALERIVVTHHHPDHFGMARWLSERHEVPVLMTHGAMEAATRGLDDREAGPPWPSDGFIDRLGIELDEPMQAILRGGIYRRIVSGAVEAGPLRPGARLAGAERDWEVSVHHGHAPGHACLHDTTAGILISGDQVLPAISSNISLYPTNEDGDPLGEYLDSLQDLSALAADTLVLPAHGRPFATLHERIEALRDEHAGRLAEILVVCRQPQSTGDVAVRLFNLDRLDPLNRLLATTETLAHLRHLELRGGLRRQGSGPGLRWHAS